MGVEQIKICNLTIKKINNIGSFAFQIDKDKKKNVKTSSTKGIMRKPELSLPFMRV